MHKYKLNIKSLSPIIGLTLFITALVVIHNSTASFRIKDIENFITRLSYTRIFAALFLVGMNFLLFSCYDFLSLQYIKKKLPIKKVIGTSMLSFSFSNVVGGTFLSGGSIRYRSYERARLSAIDILQITLFIWATWLIGVAASSGIAACIFPNIIKSLHIKYIPNLLWIGIPMLLTVATYFIYTILGKGIITLRGIKWRLPSFPIALMQILIVGIDLILSAAILYLLIPTETTITFQQFTAIFVIALPLSLISGIPSGLGVFEMLMLHLLKDYLPPYDILGALVIFRLVYYIIPLTIGALTLGINEIWHLIHPLKSKSEKAKEWAIQTIPSIFSVTTMLAGIVMLLTGTLPIPEKHITFITKIMPLNFFEMSHFLASITGLLLILVSREIYRKQKSAYYITLTLLAMGIFFEGIKGHAIISLFIFSTLFIALIPYKKSFTRHSFITQNSFSAKWLITIFVVMGTATWLLFFNYRHVEYSNELWWQFSFSSNVSRSMRAMAGTMVILLFWSIRKLLHPPTTISTNSTEQDLDDARKIINNDSNPYAALALLRDKAILFSPQRESFLMYSVINRTWVCMGDPIGNKKDFVELIWRFRELADQHSGRPLFYQIGTKHLELYIEADFNLFKLGEEAIIPLANYTLSGSEHAKQRQAINKTENNGYGGFEIIPKNKVTAILPELQAVSDAWLKQKDGKEKKFSLGYFLKEYISEFPVAVVRDNTGKIVAFANIWLGDGHTELSMDLMRYQPGTPTGIMDYLFINLFLWGQKMGYEYFNMGMTPLSGLDAHPLSPMWTKLGVWIFHNGESFYNSQGLRRYKAKFNPQWRPRYLASLGGAQLVNELISVTKLISSGLNSETHQEPPITRNTKIPTKS